MIKSIIVMLALAILLFVMGAGLVKLWFIIKRERNQEFQDSVKQSIRADAASDRLEAAYKRTTKTKTKGS